MGVVQLTEGVPLDGKAPAVALRHAWDSGEAYAEAHGVDVVGAQAGHLRCLCGLGIATSLTGECAPQGS